MDEIFAVAELGFPVGIDRLDPAVHGPTAGVAEQRQFEVAHRHIVEQVAEVVHQPHLLALGVALHHQYADDQQQQQEADGQRRQLVAVAEQQGLGPVVEQRVGEGGGVEPVTGEHFVVEHGLCRFGRPVKIGRGGAAAAEGEQLVEAAAERRAVGGRRGEVAADDLGFLVPHVEILEHEHRPPGVQPDDFLDFRA